ncbi:hypothetical protein [Halarchaeum sp. P4]|uniref:hypothetical protein n=1 Tax=Halarchaeum sp. P4 TaxID=3421639 RepID=UPI003EB93FF2
MSDDSDTSGNRAFGTGNHLTYTELHATLLGVLVGAIAAYVAFRGFDGVSVALAAGFVGLALGVDLGGRLSHGQRILQREPWYALGGFVAVGGLVLFLTTP